jgi:hypothetical protein
MVGLAVIGMSSIYLITKNAEVVLGFSFGASSLALLAKAGGGIYTKTADIALTWSARSKSVSPKTIPATRLWWRTTWATTWVMWPVWARTSSIVM